jgi:hypothetical protein
MIAVEVLNQLDNLVLEGVNDCLDLSAVNITSPPSRPKTAYLLWGCDELNHLLQSASSVLVESNLDHLRRRVVDERSALLVV